jgi:hypothetical protein
MRWTDAMDKCQRSDSLGSATELVVVRNWDHAGEGATERVVYTGQNIQNHFRGWTVVAKAMEVAHSEQEDTEEKREVQTRLGTATDDLQSDLSMRAIRTS